MGEGEKKGRREEETYLPVGYRALAASLIEHLFPDPREAGWAREVAALMRNLAGHGHDVCLARLKGLYAHFNPDWDGGYRPERTEAELAEAREELVAGVDRLLRVAGFRHLPGEDLERSLRVVTGVGLRIRLDRERFAVLRFYYRSFRHKEERRRRLGRLHRAAGLEPGVYGRVALVVVPREEREIYFKLFKEIANTDLEALVPEARISMTIRDHVVLLASGGAGASSAWKLAFAAVPAPFKGILIGIVAAALGVAGRTWFNFRRLRDVWRARLARYLYYHAISSNLGCLAQVCELAESEAAKQAFLAYAFARAGAGRGGASALARTAKRYVEDLTARRVAVTLREGLSLLRAWRVISISRTKAIRAGRPERVARRLDAIWDDLWSADRHRNGPPEDAVSGRSARVRARGRGNAGVGR